MGVTYFNFKINLKKLINLFSFICGIKINFCILEAVRSIKKYADVPNIDIEKPLKNWMAQDAQWEKLKLQKSSHVFTNENNLKK